MKWPNRLVIATHNSAKSAQMIKILSLAQPSVEILTLADFNVDFEPEETGTTYRENAEIKAQSACERTGEWCVSDDAGLEIDFFNGSPGVYSKRFMGEKTPFEEKNRAILADMENVPQVRRGARFQCAVCLAIPDKEPIHFFSSCDGSIAFELNGTNGFGYDPIFYVPEFDTTMADLDDDRKFSISHRGKVFRQLIDYLNS